MPSTGEYLVIGAVAGIATFLVTPLVAALARWRGWLYEPNDRTVHTQPIPAFGGLAMYVGFLVALATARPMDAFDPLFARNSEPRGVLLAATIIVAVGLFDDIKGLSAPAKVTGTVVAGLALVWLGVTMYYFRLPFLGVFVLSDDWIPLITVLWLLGMTQAINLIDGLDGLAAGIVAIAAGAFFLYSQRLSTPRAAARAEHRPADGDHRRRPVRGLPPAQLQPGAHLHGRQRRPAARPADGRVDQRRRRPRRHRPALHRPDVLLPRPTRAAAVHPRRARARPAVRRRPPGDPPQGLDVADKGHLHHRLMNLGHGHRRSVLILWTWTVVLSAFVLYPVLSGENPTYLPFGMMAIGIVLYTVLHPSVRKHRRANGG